MGRFGRVPVLDVVPLRAMVAVASLARAPSSKAKKPKDVFPTRNQRKRKILLAEEEEAAYKQDVLLAELPQAKHPALQKDGKIVPLAVDDGVDKQSEADVASLSTVLKYEGGIFSSLQETVDGFHKEMQKTMQGFHKEKLVSAEQVTELEMHAVAKLEEVIKLQGLLKESKESAALLTNSMAELKDKPLQSESRRAEMDIKLAEAVSLQRSASREGTCCCRERASRFRFLQSPAFKEACIDKFAEYYDSRIETKAGMQKLGDEGPKWLEADIYHGIQLILWRTRRVNHSFPPPGVDIRTCTIQI
ncbi:unnamed protein product [Cuscuta campestris]|uniref:Uncharacterized protein n=1 Tax=Cuscuta campestris TaxID=132261 RepID=A0A484LWF3_9ASTE|nr:unnamed protein product [Cuscuta campestris]